MKNPPECKEFFTDMLQNAGYRHTFEIWASAVAGGLAEKRNETKRLDVAKPAYRSTARKICVMLRSSPEHGANPQS